MRSCETAIIGDRMDTDIIAGIEAEIDTVLVLSGVSTMENIKQFAFCPDHIFAGLHEFMEKIAK
jgi:NagD protein